MRLPWRSTVLVGLALVAGLAAAAGPGGHYYLEGVREVGSELVLHADGRFEWGLAYGALDQTARGRWALRDDRVLLTTDPAPADRAPFRLLGAVAWDAAAEERLRKLEADRMLDLVLARCPLLAVEDAASAPAVVNAATPSKAALIQAAQAGLTALARARAEVETAAAAAMAEGADAAAMASAVAAMETYRGQLAQARDAHAVAGLAWPQLPEPSLPAACNLPPAYESDGTISTGPGQGLGVRVGDPEAGLRYSGIRVDFEFSDGHRETRVTNRGGWALLRPRAGAHLRRVVLGFAADHGEPAVPRTWPFEAQAVRGDLLDIALDSTVLAKPAFTRMELRVDGDALVPTWPDGDEQGRYVRH